MQNTVRLLKQLYIAYAMLLLTGCAASSPLIQASLDGDLTTVKSLVSQGASLDIQDCQWGFDFICCTPITCAANKNNTDIVKFLIEHGANIETRDSQGHQLGPLHYAAYRGNLPLVYYLLQKGADIEATSKFGTPIRLAEFRHHTETQNILAEAIKKKYINAHPQQQDVANTFNSTLPYDTLATVPPGLPLPIDGLWTIGQGRMRIAAGRMYFTNQVPGIARENLVNIKDIKQTGAKAYALNGFVAYNGKGYYVPGEFNVVSEKTLLLTLYPKPELGLPNGYNEVYTREKLDDDALFASQLTVPAAVTSDRAGEISIPNFKSPPDHNAVAIVIGIEKYQSLPNAGFVRSDAGLMREYLKAMGYQDRNIEFLTDERATFTSIRKAIETWLPNRINTQSRVTVYYAGHGAPDPQSGEAYIVPYDGDPNYLPDTGYPLKRLYERLEKLPAKQVVVMIDACFSGAGGRGVLATGARSLVRIEKATPKGDRIVVLTSTQGSQISTSSPDKKHGLFTYYLLKALQENNQDLSAVFDYLKPLVEDEAKRMNVEQTPSISPESSAIKGVFRLW